MSVITISRQYGSAGTEIAELVCRHLGYKYVDKQIIAKAANEAGVPGGRVVEFDEHHSLMRSFIDRLLYPGPYVVAQVAVTPGGDGEAGALTVEELDKAECLNLVRSAIHAAYQEGNAVIVGRGGQAALQSVPGVLHVRIVAPMPVRLLNIQKKLGVGLEEAYRLAIRHDKKTAAYLSQVFDIEVDDPLLYHLVLNTGKFSVEQAEEIVANAVARIETAMQPVPSG